MAGRRAFVIASRVGLQQLVRRLTINYEAVAESPLQRQSSHMPSRIPERHKTQGESLTEAQASEEVSFGELMEQYDIKTNFHQQYKVIRQIAEESSGNVHLCSNRVTDVVFAVKILKSQKPLTSSYAQLNEVLVLHELRQHNHPSIMRIVGVFADFDINEILFVSAVAEEDLFATITRKKKLTESETRTVFKQLFSALEFLVSLPYC